MNHAHRRVLTLLAAFSIQAVSFAQCPGDCDESGVVDFNDLVSMLFEFGESTPSCDTNASGTVDFDDLVSALFLFGDCPQNVVRNLRTDAEGNNPTCFVKNESVCTDGLRAILAYKTSPGTYGISVVSLTLETESVITRISAIGGWSTLNWGDPLTLNVYNTLDEFAASPFHGSVFETSDVLFGERALTGGQNGPPFVYDHYFVTMEFEPFVLPAGTYWLALYKEGGGQWYWAETLVDLGSDAWNGNTTPGQFVFYDTLAGFTTGTAALDVLGYPVDSEIK